MGIDRPDDADVPSDNPADRTPPAANDAQRSAVTHVETRHREEYYSARTQVAQEERATTGAQQERPAPDTWTETANLAHWMWGEYHRRWPPEERLPVDRSTDPPGSWRSDSNRYLDSAVNEDMEEECDHIVERERERVSPALREAESRDPDRHLVGFQYRLKKHDRIKEKVAEAIEQYGRSPKEAISHLPDAIRYTFQYQEAHYTRGVRDDIEHLRELGFEMVGLRNSWLNEQYKGINSHWIEPHSGQRFELQFHTRISFEAKQLTHGSYERLRSGQADEFEGLVLEAFQKRVSGAVPVPAGAADIPDYPDRKRHAR